MLQINKITLMLIPVWSAFILLTWAWGCFADKNVSFLSLLWEYRTSFFTSIIIVSFTNTANGISKYKEALWFRHKCLCDLTDLLNDFFSFLYSQATDQKGPYAILFSRKRFDTFIQEIEGVIKPNEEMHKHIENIKQLLIKIKKDKNYSTAYSFDGASFNHIDVCIERILSFDDDVVLKHLTLFFDLINNFGWIWRIDIETRIKMDKILHEKYGFAGYDNKCLYEIYCCNDINNDPYK